MEILVKNCQMGFHRILFIPKFCENILRILAKRRKKPEIFNTLVSGNKMRQEEIENRLLFLVQLWFDTFMLHEDMFKPIINIYK